jgi:hypothetical protein
MWDLQNGGMDSVKERFSSVFEEAGVASRYQTAA